MSKLLNEIKFDLKFIQSHTLQPRWYKIAKVFIILGFLLGYYLLFGITTTIVFFVLFMLLSALVHLVYRVKTNKYTQSWLDFIVAEEDGKRAPKSIGKYYYTAIVINLILSIVISQVLT
jgi:hypothetical protein